MGLIHVWNRVKNQILGEFKFRFKSSEKRNIVQGVTSGEWFLMLCLRGYFSAKVGE